MVVKREGILAATEYIPEASTDSKCSIIILSEELIIHHDMLLIIIGKEKKTICFNKAILILLSKQFLINLPAQHKKTIELNVEIIIATKYPFNPAFNFTKKTIFVVISNTVYKMESTA